MGKCGIFLAFIIYCGGEMQGVDSTTTVARRVFNKILRPAGSSSGPAMTISYEAMVYEPAEAVPITGNPDWNTLTPESSFRAIFLANKLGDTNLIARGFIPTEREKIRSMTGQKEMIAKNTALYARIAKVTLLQKTFYGDYIILTTAQEDTTANQWRASYVFKLTEEGWLLTNELASDRVYSQLMEIIVPKPSEKTK